ncbi:hypothetical protein U1Q18_002524 [Sarracenia purpurea var. burkii]
MGIVREMGGGLLEKEGEELRMKSVLEFNAIAFVVGGEEECEGAAEWTWTLELTFAKLAEFALIAKCSCAPIKFLLALAGRFAFAFAEFSFVELSGGGVGGLTA